MCRPCKRKCAASSRSWTPCSDSLNSWLPTPAQRDCRCSNPSRTLCAAASRMPTLQSPNGSARWLQHCSTDVTFMAAWMTWRSGWRRCSGSWTQAAKSTLMKLATLWLNWRYYSPTDGFGCSCVVVVSLWTFCIIPSQTPGSVRLCAVCSLFVYCLSFTPISLYECVCVCASCT